MSSPLLDIKHLSCERDARVLFEDLSFSVNPGDILYIEGPNGCGKTTLLRAVTGLLPEFNGEVLWRGVPIRQGSYDYASELLFLGHLPGVKKNLTPKENLQFLGELNTSIEARDIERSLAQVGLMGYEDVPGQQLSAGQLRRVGLARLYLSRARLWVLDEPYTAIDKQGIARLEQRFVEHAEKGGAVVLTSHQLPDIDQMQTISLSDYAFSSEPDGGAALA